jgi:hypothetical protein
MRNVTVKYYKGGEMLMVGWRNCARCGRYCECDMHHVRTKSRGGKKLVPLCRYCHIWVGDHPKAATKLGLYKGGYEIRPKQ